MDFRLGARDRSGELVRLFAETFTASEGPGEGRLIGGLAEDLFTTTPDADLVVVSASVDGDLAGCIAFSRLTFEGDDRRVFVLAPVAVATARQGQGVGQALIRHGLDALRRRGADVAVTYGDPSFYGKVGFAPIREADVPAPFALSQPEGWLGQSLTDRPLGAFAGPSRCVAALNRPEFW
jgi:predicted N-acetyltransferase YhbS